MRILCCGATGMVGTGLLEELLAQTDWQIRATVHNSPPHLRDPRIEYVRADLTQAHKCQEVAEGCELAVLAAAVTAGAQQNREAPENFVTPNLVLNAQMLHSLAQSQARRVILVSTASLYPERAEPWREDELDLNEDPPAAFFGIGWAMRSLEKVARLWHDRRGLDAIAVRLANVYGPWARFDPATSNFIPALVRKAVAHDDPFCVWGSPAVARDVLYVSDCARALRMLLQDGPSWGTFNLAAGHSVTVDEVVKAALAAADHAPTEVRYDTSAPTTVARRAYSIAALQTAVGWSPAVGLQEGLRLTTAWWRGHQATWRR